MSAAVHAIEDAIGTVATIVFFPTLVLTEATWEYIGYPVLKAIFNFFGVKDEELISTEVIVQRIINDTNGYNAAMTSLALMHEKDPNGTVISHYVQNAAAIRAKYLRYFDYGKNTYYRGLPSTNIRTTKISPSIVKTSIDADLSITSTVLVAIKDEPTKDSWCGYHLQSTNQYKPATNELVVDAITYYIAHIDYNYNTNNYDVTCNQPEVVTTNTTKTTTVTITNIDTTTDNKNITITERVVKTGSVSGNISDVTTTISSVDTSIPIGSEVDSTTSETTTTTASGVASSVILNVTAYIPEEYIIAKYYDNINSTSSDWYYWFYKIGSGTHPILDNTGTLTGTMEFMPIAVIRNNFINTNADKTSVAYLETQELLKSIGIDLDNITESISNSPDISNVADAFIHFSLNLSDDTPEINKLVYETFAQLFEDSGLYNDQGTDSDTGEPLGGYSASIMDMPFNTALGWKKQSKKIVTGVIGPTNTYQKLIVPSKEIAGGSLVLRKQVTPTQYIEYTMDNVTGTTFIQRTGKLGTHTGVSGKNLIDGIEIPLGFFSIDLLNFEEQTKLLPYALKLSIYAAQLTYLKWYKTESFQMIIQIIAIIVTIVVSFYTAGAGAGIGAVLESLFVNLAIGLAVGYAFKLLMKSNLPDWLKAVGTVIIIAIALYAGTSYNSGEFLNASQLSSAVTEASALTIAGTVAGVVTLGAGAVGTYTSYKMEQLHNREQQFKAESDQRLKSFTAAEELAQMGGVIDTTVVVDLVNKEIPEAYIKSIDAFYYKAKGEIQYQYNMLYDYNIHKDDFISSKLTLGII